MFVKTIRRSTPVLFTLTVAAAAYDGGDLETPGHNGARDGASE